MIAITLICALLQQGQGQGQGRPGEGPKVGDAAPDFTLKTLADAKKEVKLSQCIEKEKKPVVLIFGSYT